MDNTVNLRSFDSEEDANDCDIGETGPRETAKTHGIQIDDSHRATEVFLHEYGKMALACLLIQFRGRLDPQAIEEGFWDAIVAQWKATTNRIQNGDLNGPENALSYFIKIAKRKLWKQLRRPTGAELTWEPPAPNRNDPVERAEFYQIVKDAISTLPPHYRRVLKTDPRIADVINEPEELEPSQTLSAAERGYRRSAWKLLRRYVKQHWGPQTTER